MCSGVGRQNVAPQIVRTQRETGHIFQAGARHPPARRGAHALRHGGGQRRGCQLRKVRGERDDAVVFLRIEDHDAGADALQPRAEVAGRRRCQLGRRIRRQRPGAAAKKTAIGLRRPALLFAGHGVAAQELAAGDALPRQIDDFALGAAGVGDDGIGADQGSRCRMVSRMRPMVWERKTRSAWATASASGAPRSMAPAAMASVIAPGELTPVIGPSNPAWRKARPKDAPIRPVPTMTTLFMREAPAGRRNRLPHL
jgi:hypothetical protein